LLGVGSFDGYEYDLRLLVFGALFSCCVPW
jgi:hypothetical protein